MPGKPIWDVIIEKSQWMIGSYIYEQRMMVRGLEQTELALNIH